MRTKQSKAKGYERLIVSAMKWATWGAVKNDTTTKTYWSNGHKKTRMRKQAGEELYPGHHRWIIVPPCGKVPAWVETFVIYGTANDVAMVLTALNARTK